MAIQILRGTSSQRQSSTQVLADGQPFYDTEFKYVYVGDGTTALKSLSSISADLNQVDIFAKPTYSALGYEDDGTQYYKHYYYTTARDPQMYTLTQEVTISGNSDRYYAGGSCGFSFVPKDADGNELYADPCGTYTFSATFPITSITRQTTVFNGWLISTPYPGIEVKGQVTVTGYFVKSPVIHKSTDPWGYEKMYVSSSAAYLLQNLAYREPGFSDSLTPTKDFSGSISTYSGSLQLSSRPTTFLSYPEADIVPGASPSLDVQISTDNGNTWTTSSTSNWFNTHNTTQSFVGGKEVWTTTVTYLGSVSFTNAQIRLRWYWPQVKRYTK